MEMSARNAQHSSKMATRSGTSTSDNQKGPYNWPDIKSSRKSSHSKTPKPHIKSLSETIQDSAGKSIVDKSDMPMHNISHTSHISHTLCNESNTETSTEQIHKSTDIPASSDSLNNQSQLGQPYPNDVSGTPGSVNLPPSPIAPLLPPGNLNTSVLADAINKMHATMITNQTLLAEKMEGRFSSLEIQLSNLHEKYEKQEASFRSLTQGMAKQSDLERLEGSITNMASQADEKFFSIDQELESLRTLVTGLQTENMRLSHRLHFIEEKQSFNDIKAKQHLLTIEGLIDDKDTDPKIQVIQKLNNEADAGLEEDDIVSARRMGKAMKARRSRNILLVTRDDNARDKILQCRGKLTVEIPNTSIWINEDVPANYRRRKSMLRDLVKVANAKKYRAKIDQGGVSINGKLYLPHQFELLPVGIRPQDIMCKRTLNDGLAFASEWAPLSNMYRTNIMFDGVLYGSAEQGYQHRKALFENKDDLAEMILISSDPYECKKIGIEVGESPEWEAISESTMNDIVSAKFQQNSKIADYLCDTEDSPLYEATHDEFWGIGLPIHSQDAIDEKGKGQNKLGNILMALRQTLLAAQSTGSDCTTSRASLHPAAPESGHTSTPKELSQETGVL